MDRGRSAIDDGGAVTSRGRGAVAAGVRRGQPRSAWCRRSIRRQIIGVKISCIARSILPPGTDDGVRPRHEGVVQHRQQVGEVDAARIGEADHQHALVGVGTWRAMNGFDVSTTGTRWKLMCVRENCGQM